MRRWARGQLLDPSRSDRSDGESNEAAAALGLQIVEADEEVAKSPLVCYLWPCNVRMYDLWGELQTQWMVSMQGREGLNYDSVIRYLREVAHIRPRRLPEVMGCIQILERTALDVWNEQREQRQLEQEQQRQSARR